EVLGRVAHPAPPQDVRRASRGGPSTTRPTTTAPIEADSTAAAAKSLAVPASWWKFGDERSTTDSTALFISSMAKTTVHAITMGAAGARSQAAVPSATRPIATSSLRFGCVAHARASPEPATANDLPNLALFTLITPPPGLPVSPPL